MGILTQSDDIAKLLKAVDLQKMLEEEFLNINTDAGTITKSKKQIGKIKSCVKLVHSLTGKKFEQHITVSLELTVTKKEVSNG